MFCRARRNRNKATSGQLEGMMMQKKPIGKCGMTCTLCPRHYTKGRSCCEGCNSESFFSQICMIFACCTKKKLNGCWECGEYPCTRLTHRKNFKGIYSQDTWLQTCEMIRSKGLDAWYREYAEKSDMIEQMLTRYNNGRLKSFICNLFMNNDLATLKRVAAEGEKIPYKSPSETGPLFREAVERMEGVSIGTPKDD